MGSGVCVRTSGVITISRMRWEYSGICGTGGTSVDQMVSWQAQS